MILADMTDRALAGEVRNRELAYGEALSELSKRQRLSALGEWTEPFVAACLSRRRQEREWHPTTHEQNKIERLPPPLFRAGYEWAALSIMAVLESVLDHPSQDAVELWESKPVGRDLYRLAKKVKVYDARRRGAFELIQMLERFINGRLAALYVPHPVKATSTFTPSDDDFAAVRHQQTPHAR